MAITSGSFTNAFQQGLADGNIESTSAPQNGQTEWNAQITAAVMNPGVPVDNGGPRQKG